MTRDRGVYVNTEKGWYEWNPIDLEENVFFVIAGLVKQLGKEYMV